MKLRGYQKILLIALSVIVLALLCELFSYGVMSGLSRFGIFDDTFEAAISAKRSKLLLSPEPRQKYHPYLLFQVEPNSTFAGCGTDKYGFLHNGDPDAFNPYKKDEGTYRIFFMGGSSAASYHAESNSQTIAAFLERFLNNDDSLKEAYKAKRFEVINAGRSGYFSTQELLFAILDLNYYKPDMIITFDGYNEWRMSIEADWEPHLHMYSKTLINGFNRAQSVLGLSSMIAGTIRQHIVSAWNHVFHYTKFMLKAVVYKIKSFMGSRGKIRYRKYPVDRASIVNEKSIDVYRENLINFVGIYKIRGVKYIALLQPTFGLYKNTLGEHEKKILREYGYAKEHKASYFARLKKLFSSLAAEYGSEDTRIDDMTGLFKNETGDIYLDFCHYNERGNELIAGNIYEVIKAQ